MTDKNTSRNGLLLNNSGPSGAGKGTLVKELFNLRSDCVPSVSATTRAPRQGEVDGVDYHFIDNEKFLAMAENNEFLEWDHHFSASYGTPRRFVEEAMKSGKHVVLEIDVNGAEYVMNHEKDCVGIFILPPSKEILVERLRGRGTESEDQIAERLLRAKTELRKMSGYKYTVVNDNLEDAVRLMNSIIDAEMARTDRQLADNALDLDM